jgi:hypothetical protein
MAENQERSNRAWVSVGFKINLGNYQSADFDFGLSIDTSVPLEPQLEAATGYLMGTADFLEAKLAEKMMKSGVMLAVRQRPPGPAV